jgi:hypothetical protein
MNYNTVVDILKYVKITEKDCVELQYIIGTKEFTAELRIGNNIFTERLLVSGETLSHIKGGSKELFSNIKEGLIERLAHKINGEKKTVTEELSWDFEGSGHFKATLTNKQISNLQFCFNGNDDSNCLKSTDKNTYPIFIRH